MLQPGNELIQMQSLLTLATLLSWEGNQVYFYKANGLHRLLELIRSINPGIQLRVLEVLSTLATNDKMDLIILKAGVLKRLIPLLQTKSPILREQALQSIARFAQRRGLRGEMLGSGLVLHVFNVFADDPQSQPQPVLLHAAKALVHLAGEGEDCGGLPAGAIGSVLPVLQVPYPDVRLEIVKFLAKMLQDGGNRGLFLGQGGVAPLVEALNADSNPDLQLHGLTALRYFLQDGPSVGEMLGRSGVLRLLAEDCLNSPHEAVQLQASRIVAFLASIPSNKPLLKAADAIQALVQLAESSSDEIQENALIALANMSDDPGCREVIGEEEGLYPMLMALEKLPLDSTPNRTAERLLWALSNFATIPGLGKVIVGQGMESVVGMLAHPSPSVHSLALKTIILLIRASEEGKNGAKQAGAVGALNRLASSNNRTVSTAAQKALELLN
jgi:hypothetical protein